MDFMFMVGKKEKHMVAFHFNRFWGNLDIRVDGKTVIKDIRIGFTKLIKKYEFPVGYAEPHKVVIEKERKLFLAGFRKQKYRVFIDERLMQEYEGY